MKRVLDRNEPLESKSDSKPDAEAGKDGASVDQSLAKALPVEEVYTNVVQPDD